MEYSVATENADVHLNILTWNDILGRKKISLQNSTYL